MPLPSRMARFSGAEGHVATGPAALLEVLLVVVLGLPERRCRRDLGDDALAVVEEAAAAVLLRASPARSFDRVASSNCSGEVVKISERYWEPMSGPGGSSWSGRGWPRALEQLLVGDLGGVEGDLDGLGVAGAASRRPGGRLGCFGAAAGEADARC